MAGSYGEEKRRSQRHACEAAIRWSYLNQSATHLARALNFSRGGVYLETGEAPRPGTTVLIRVDRRLAGGTADDFSTCLPTVVVADAKWCHELSQGGERRFGVGLRYQFPVL